MLSRFLKIWLILSIFGYGMVLASDVHGDLAGVQDVHLMDNNADPADDDGCHHCAHGVSHLLGLNYSGGAYLPNTRCVSPAPYDLNWSSLSPPSLLRPPIYL
ncbi:hypothetical protein [Thiolapillus sp.]